MIITGAGKGIGRASALLLAARGAQVVAISRTQSDLDSLLRETGGRAIAADLAEADEARRAMAEAGTCDFLVNCAGTNVLESLLDLSDAGYAQIMNINLRAALICAQAFAQARIATGGGGAIVNVSSIAGHRGFRDHVVYAASKAGLEGASRAMARELGPHGIRVSALVPTVTLTELAIAAWSDPARSAPMLERHPMGRFAEAEEVARSVALLLSEDAAFVSGSALAVDGGFLAV